MRKKTALPEPVPEALRSRYTAATIADGSGAVTPHASPLGDDLRRAMTDADLGPFRSIRRGETLVIRDAENKNRVCARRAFGAHAWTLPYLGPEPDDEEAPAPVARGIRHA